MASSSDRPMEAAHEGLGTSVSQPQALEEVGEHFSNQYVPHTSGSEVGNHQGVRVGSHLHMSRDTQTMNPPFQQMTEFFHHMAESMHDPNKINFEKNEKNGWSGAGTIIKEEKDKCRKFEDGLNDSIRKNVAILQHENFCKLVSAAVTWERLDKEEASRNENKFRKPRPDFGGPSKRGRFDDSKAGSVNRPPQQKQNRSEFSTASTPNYGQGKPRVPTCPQCGKNHYGTCRRSSGACFNCGSFDHKVKDCPNPNNAPSLRIQGSVHSLLLILLKLIEVQDLKSPKQQVQVEVIKLVDQGLLHALML
uniref:CCHC-type domain-containing protein n=1 Tax=Solanum tuberosum TaxID=4113 RepID=M1DSU3_SOLTU